MSTYPKITLRKGKEESLLRFHPWVFSGAIESLPDCLEEGDAVSVYTHNGDFLGNGHYQIGSIAVRMLTLFDDVPLDEAFFTKRIAEASAMRRSLGLPSEKTDAYRLVHGEGDFLPGLVIDVYGPTAVMQAHSPGMHFQRNVIAQALAAQPGLGVKNVYYKSDTTLPYKAELDPCNEYILGQYSGDTATENGLRFRIDWLKGQKTGFFIDQRDNRALLRSLSRDKRVLNMFCYTGGFSVYALDGGAREVCSVDSSAKAISLTDANVALNFGDATAGGRHSSSAEDAFRYLEGLPEFDQANPADKPRYDVIILDPPAFAKHRSAIRNALRGYQRLNALGISRVQPGGIVFTFSCSQAITREQFRLAVFSAAAQTGRRVRILHQLTQPADHPVNIYHPEGEYLKGLVLYVE
ncbi:MAG: class I SAM-dependent rRNA methyltransferase [Muribaculaceae bacterium]|nr:class I SAM-dependent rRNA methyltransferase [Muribaculaceae bacterium]